MTIQQVIAAAAGVALSLVMAYVPGVSEKFKALPSNQKRMWLLILMAAISIIVFAASCADIDLGIQIACTKDGAVNLIGSFIAAAIANQSTYTFIPTDRK